MAFKRRHVGTFAHLAATMIPIAIPILIVIATEAILEHDAELLEAVGSLVLGVVKDAGDGILRISQLLHAIYCKPDAQARDGPAQLGPSLAHQRAFGELPCIAHLGEDVHQEAIIELHPSDFQIPSKCKIIWNSSHSPPWQEKIFENCAIGQCYMPAARRISQATAFSLSKPRKGRFSLNIPLQISLVLPALTTEGNHAYAPLAPANMLEVGLKELEVLGFRFVVHLIHISNDFNMILRLMGEL
ncbi:hypothetical protein SELMODRAFT_405023 [Selaginella moellendorffii]|uniref:Uncharacterized protein n=1 Tax=Selaginella moellendorffii TaxID=88036 RepID=D8QY52_SELML|nr:hypothetical protein SELMODRAFT_405023 [Selaginella moellendorffii]